MQYPAPAPAGAQINLALHTPCIIFADKQTGHPNGVPHHSIINHPERLLRHVGDRHDLGAPLQSGDAGTAGRRRGAAGAEAYRRPGQIPFDHPDRHHADRHPHGYLLGRCAGHEIRPGARRTRHFPAHGHGRGADHDRHRRNLPDPHIRGARAQTHRHELGGKDRQAGSTAHAPALAAGLAVRDRKSVV